MQSSLIFKSRSRQFLDVSKRDKYALNALDRTKIKITVQNVEVLTSVVKAINKRKNLKAAVIKSIKEQFLSLLQVLIVESPLKPLRQGSVYDTMTF